MALSLQNGIYYSKKQKPGNSFCILSLRIKPGTDISKVCDIVSELWGMYKDLERGILVEFKESFKYHKMGSTSYTGNLSVLIGYGPPVFDMTGIRKRRPSYLDEKWLFRKPDGAGGGPILGEIGLKYAPDILENPVANDHIIIQFIGDTELVTQRAVVETWKTLRKIEMASGETGNVQIRSFFTGFNRPDNRSWLGFHDGVSNIRAEDRLKAISINRNNVGSEDAWTSNGTYLAFIRIAINLDLWERTDVQKQEQIVGRDKTTGCPLVGVDNVTGKNILMRGCPAPGTSEIFDDGNEAFRDHPPYGSGQNPYLGAPDNVLQKSHIGRMYKRQRYFGGESQSNRIFRQGYEFLESIDVHPKFRAGLNFVSFQNGTNRLYDILTNGLGRSNFGGETNGDTDDLLTVRAAGIFVVPPCTQNERFPGEGIFK